MIEPTAGQIALIILSIAFFVIGGVVSLMRLKFDRPWSRLAAKACMYFGILFSTAGVLWHSMTRNSWLPLEDNFDTLIWLALVLSIFVMYVQRRKPLGGLDWFVMPVVVLLLVGAVLFGLLRPQSYDARGLWAWVHRVGAYGGAAGFAVAAATGCMFLIANYRVRHKLSLTSVNLGSLERLEHLTLEAVTIGFALLTIGAVTGFVRMKYENRPASMTTIVLSGAVWITYALVLHSPFNPSFRGRRAAVLSVVGFVLMVGTIVTVLLMPGGHG